MLVTYFSALFMWLLHTTENDYDDYVDDEKKDDESQSSCSAYTIQSSSAVHLCRFVNPALLNPCRLRLSTGML